MINNEFQIGEALVGEEPEIAHIDLIIGEKKGAIGQAFVNSFAQPKMGHTPILAVLRPNLPVKPSTLIVPKVTLRNLEGAERLFGPAQSAVAKAVADVVEEGMIPAKEIEEVAIIVSVFIHPRGRDYQRIYRYNYAATKLALKRALEGFPNTKTVAEEKDKASHDMIGFRINNLAMPPYLGISLENDSWIIIEGILKSLPRKDAIIIKVTAPLIKRYGVEICQKIHQIRPESIIISDMKTLDTGNLEARMAGDATADVITFSGRAPIKTQERFMDECKKVGALALMDTTNLSNPLKALKKLNTKPEIVELRWIPNKAEVTEIKKVCGIKTLIAVDTDIEIDKIKGALTSGVDILFVGKSITGSEDIQRKTMDYLDKMEVYEVDQFRVMTDF
jgi:bifunctional enzyme Fae/Hps|tara:strand:- start:4367 stop:5539 length:1173 start_codon:yes stop_codon:yes gene_type:complete